MAPAGAGRLAEPSHRAVPHRVAGRLDMGAGLTDEHAPAGGARAGRDRVEHLPQGRRIHARMLDQEVLEHRRATAGQSRDEDGVPDVGGGCFRGLLGQGREPGLLLQRGDQALADRGGTLGRQTGLRVHRLGQAAEFGQEAGGRDVVAGVLRLCPGPEFVQVDQDGADRPFAAGAPGPSLGAPLRPLVGHGHLDVGNTLHHSPPLDDHHYLRCSRTALPHLRALPRLKTVHAVCQPRTNASGLRGVLRHKVANTCSMVGFFLIHGVRCSPCPGAFVLVAAARSGSRARVTILEQHRLVGLFVRTGGLRPSGRYEKQSRQGADR
ncbi:hypothetical protein SXANM310S_02193 [Streptomyces xanthochromogenes]